MPRYIFDKVAVEAGTWKSEVLQPKAVKVDADSLNEAFKKVIAREDWMKRLPDGRYVRYHLRRVK